MGNVVTSALVRARKPKPSEPTDEWLGFTQLERQNSSGRGVAVGNGARDLNNFTHNLKVGKAIVSIRRRALRTQNRPICKLRKNPLNFVGAEKAVRA